MIRSMTAFAVADSESDAGRVVWEIRTVNHRYLDINLRLPEDFRRLEPDIRSAISTQVQRGKVDATLKYQAGAGGSGGRLRLNQALADELLALHRQLAASADQNQQPELLEILRWPGVVEENPPDLSRLQQQVTDTLNETLERLIRARRREGDAMAAVISERVDGVETWIGKLREWLPEIRIALRERLQDKIGQLPQPLDEGRLEQEVAFLAQKIDIDEELDRLAAHVAEVRRVLSLGEPVGRRLDFLMQEFNRESNTLGSKSVDQRSTQASVELKVLIEQMREQVQNVE